MRSGDWQYTRIPSGGVHPGGAVVLPVVFDSEAALHRLPDVPVDLIGGAHIENRPDDLLSLREGDRANDPFDLGYTDGAHTVLVETESEEDYRRIRVSRHLAAHRNGDAPLVGRLDNFLY